MSPLNRLRSPFVILALLANVLCAADPPPTTVTKLIPSSNGFQHDFGSRAPGDVLTVVVGADPTYTLVSGAVTGGNPIWVGQGLFTATATMPDHQAGEHNGTFAGKYKPPGQPGGDNSGTTELPDWNGAARAKSIDIISDTVKHAPDGTPDTRRTVGVCVKVDFALSDSSSATTWTASAGDPLTGSGATWRWSAPHSGGAVTITASLATGGTCTATMQVVPPQALSGVRDAEWTTDPVLDLVNGTIPAGTAGAGMFLTMTVAPLNVSFGYCEAKEVPTDGENLIGYFTRFTPAQLHHSTAGHWWIITDDNEWFDTAATVGAAQPWSTGSYQWTIPNHYRCLGEEDPTGSLYATTVQAFTIAADGTMTVSKAMQNTSRTP